MKQETVSASGISWAICKSAPRSRQITMPAPHHFVFLQAGCPSYSVKNIQTKRIKECLKNTTKQSVHRNLKPHLVAFYDLQPGNGMGLFSNK